LILIFYLLIPLSRSVSPYHAVLFNHGKNHWEILNYSPHGLSVDGVEYGLEKPEFEDIEESEIPVQSLKDRIHDIRGSIVFGDDNSMKWKSFKKSPESDSESENSEPETKPEVETDEDKRPKCDCKDPEAGWESAAPVNHGSIINFGCHKYIFAVR
jgi:hypothetical protein